MKNKTVRLQKFTLIELIASFGVFVVIMFVLMSLFGVAQKIWTSSAQKSALYENARIAMDLMARDFQGLIYNDENSSKGIYPFLRQNYNKINMITVTETVGENDESKIREVKYALANGTTLTRDGYDNGGTPTAGLLLRSATGDSSNPEWNFDQLPRGDNPANRPWRIWVQNPIDINKNEQFQPWFLKIAPNNRIPAIVDRDGPDGKPLALFESGAILIYLAEKTKSPLLPADARGRAIAIQWLMWQMGGVGPMFGQAPHFLRFAKEDVPYGKKRYHDEAKRLYGVMDRRLAEAPYLAGDAYTIADVATYPWVARHEWHQVDLAEFAHVRRWFDAIGRRPAVDKGMKVPS